MALGVIWSLTDVRRAIYKAALHRQESLLPFSVSPAPAKMTVANITFSHHLTKPLITVASMHDPLWDVEA